MSEKVSPERLDELISRGNELENRGRMDTEQMQVLAALRELRALRRSVVAALFSVRDEWPEGISDGLVSPCAICEGRVWFDYEVDDETWKLVAPLEYRTRVICLPCFGKRATEIGINIGQRLKRVQFTGTGETVVSVPSEIYVYRNRAMLAACGDDGKETA